MRQDILSILKSKEASFSKGQRRIAKFILESYDKAAFMTANVLVRRWEFLSPPWFVLPWN